MDEEGKHESTETLPSPLVAWRAEIISSVLQHGLKDPLTLVEEGRRPLTSHDYRLKEGKYIPNESAKDIMGALLKPAFYYHGNKERVLYDLNDALYRGGESILPAIAERQRPDRLLGKRNPYNSSSRFSKSAQEILEQRMNASFLVIKKAPPDVFRASSPDWYAQRRGTVAGYVFPAPIWEEYSRLPGKITPFKEEVKITHGVIRREVSDAVHGVQLQLPDYETPLLEAIDQYGVIWVHGVRLPTAGDLTLFPA